MRLSLKLVAGLAAVALIATVWFQYSSHRGNGSAEREAGSAKPANRDRTALSPPGRWQKAQVAETTSAASANQALPSSATNAAVSSEQAAQATDWETQIDDILADESDDDLQKSKKLLALMPKLPQDGQIEAITHAANLLDDTHYAPLSQLVTNTLTPEDVLDVLMSDLANRTNTLKLTTFLQVARQEKHPMAEEARNLLELYLEEDYGNDWAAWEKAVQDWLREEREGAIRPDKDF